MEPADLERENALLKARLAEVEATLAQTQEANRRLEDILRTAQREKFGKRSEKLLPDQFNLPQEDAELAQGVLEAAQEKAEAAMQRARGDAPRKPKHNRGHLPSHLPRVERIFVDETRAPVLDPGRKATKSGFFWAVVSDDRGHGGAGPPIVLLHYAPGRGKAHPLKFLTGYRSRFLQCDAYQSYNALTDIARDNGPWQLVHCWTHVRRRFVKRVESEGSPIAEEMLRQIAFDHCS